MNVLTYIVLDNKIKQCGLLLLPVKLYQLVDSHCIAHQVTELHSKSTLTKIDRIPKASSVISSLVDGEEGSKEDWKLLPSRLQYLTTHNTGVISRE